MKSETGDTHRDRYSCEVRVENAPHKIGARRNVGSCSSTEVEGDEYFNTTTLQYGLVPVRA